MYRRSEQYQFATASRSSQPVVVPHFTSRRSSINDLIEKFEVPKSRPAASLQQSYKYLREMGAQNGEAVFYDDNEDVIYASRNGNGYHHVHHESTDHIEEVLSAGPQNRAARALLPIWLRFIRPTLETLAIAPLPLFFSLTGTAIFALIVIFLMPRGFSQLLLYPGFRLLFGTLYPAYASYKAVKTKNVKEYVSREFVF